MVAKDKRPFNQKLLATLNAAYARTLRYYVHLLGGGGRISSMETELSQLWKEAGRLLRGYDAGLSAELTARGSIFSEGSTWSAETIKIAWISLNAIRVSVNIMERNRVDYLRWTSSTHG